MTDSSELDLLRDSARGVLQRFPEALGLTHGDVLAPGVAKETMEVAAAQGWTAMLLPEEVGGLGLGMAAAVVLAEEVGRSLAPGPLLANVVLLPALAGATGADWATALAARAAAGEGVVSVCFTDEGDGPKARLLAEYGAEADAMIRLSLDRRDGGTVLTAWDAGSLPRRKVQPFDPACPLVELGSEGSIRPENAGRLAGDAADAVMGAAHLWIAAEMLGAAMRAGEMSIAYAGTRQQFGSPIGGYQAVKHRIVDDYVLRKNAGAILADAAAAWEEGRDDRMLLAHAARAAAGQAAVASTSHCIQVHGALGFSSESPIHLAYKRVRRLASTLGDEARSRAAIAARLVAGQAA